MPGPRNIMKVLEEGGYVEAVFEKEARALYAEMRRQGLRPVGFHKEVFGPQAFCGKRPDSKRRFWVWELGQGRVWVTNAEGAILEVEEGMTYKKAVKFWHRYQKCILEGGG